MSKAWLSLVLLLCLAACPVEARGAGGHGRFRGGGGKEPWWQVVLQIIGGMIGGFVALAICQCICRFCCKACCGCDLDDDSDSEVGVKRGRADVEQGNQRSYLYQGPSHPAGTYNYSSAKERPTTADVTATISASEPLLPAGQVVTVQMVDEQLNKMDVPPAELTLTNLNKLIADLSLYSGWPDIQGVLVKSNYGGFFEMTDLQKMPRGNLKVRAVFSGDRHMLRIYPEPQVPE